MKAADLRMKTEKELVTELNTLKKEQFNLRFQKVTEGSVVTSRVRTVKRAIARIKTLLNEKMKEASNA